MDTKEYILSGVIEAYVLGLASDEETREVQARAMQYAEVKKAITDFEKGLERQVLQEATPPPAFLKERIMNSLKEEAGKYSVIKTNTTNGKSQPQSAKVVSLTPAPKSVRWLRGAVAACIILLLGSAILNFYYYSQYKKSNKLYADLLASESVLAKQNDNYRASFNSMNDTAVVKIVMQAANEKRAGSVATVFWNKNSQQVLLTVNSLPTPASGKQYQLWAIVNGQPVDAGMVQSNNIGNIDQVIAMKNISGAQAFAITLEDAGGSPTPHLEQLFVFGKV